MINTVTLERMAFSVQQYISKDLFDFGMQPKVQVIEYAAHQLAMQVRQYVYGEHLDARTVRYPATWRDAVKDRFYAWLRSGHWPWGADLLEPRYPVKWQEVTIDVKALYPKISMPQEHHSIHIAQTSNTNDTSQRLWFDAEGRNLLDTLHRLWYEGRMGKTWHVNYPVFYEIAKLRTPMGEYITGVPSQADQTVFGMKVIIDRDMPKDTIELRDKDGRIVGKIYNIG